jgi:hypothetical protein
MHAESEEVHLASDSIEVARSPPAGPAAVVDGESNIHPLR